MLDTKLLRAALGSLLVLPCLLLAEEEVRTYNVYGSVVSADDRKPMADVSVSLRYAGYGAQTDFYRRADVAAEIIRGEA